MVKRDTLGELMDEYDETGRHAFRVMQAYERWLAGTPELQVLYLLGLFDHPIEIEVLEVLLAADIPHLTTAPKRWWHRVLKRKHQFTTQERKKWQSVIHSLREQHHLLSNHQGRGNCWIVIR